MVGEAGRGSPPHPILTSATILPAALACVCIIHPCVRMFPSGTYQFGMRARPNQASNRLGGGRILLEQPPIIMC